MSCDDHDAIIRREILDMWFGTDHQERVDLELYDDEVWELEPDAVLAGDENDQTGFRSFPLSGLPGSSPASTEEEPE